MIAKQTEMYYPLLYSTKELFLSSFFNRQSLGLANSSHNKMLDMRDRLDSNAKQKWTNIQQ